MCLLHVGYTIAISWALTVTSLHMFHIVTAGSEQRDDYENIDQANLITLVNFVSNGICCICLNKFSFYGWLKKYFTYKLSRNLCSVIQVSLCELSTSQTHVICHKIFLTQKRLLDNERHHDVVIATLHNVKNSNMSNYGCSIWNKLGT